MNESNWSLFDSTNNPNDESMNSNESTMSSLTESHDESTLESSVDLSLRASMISSSLGALLHSSSSSNDNNDFLDSLLSNTLDTNTIGQTTVESSKSTESMKSIESRKSTKSIESSKSIESTKSSKSSKSTESTTSTKSTKVRNESNENNQDLPSTSFFNVGSLLLNSERTENFLGNWMESMDEATALKIAMKAQGLTTKVLQPKDMNLNDEYTCQLCQHYMVGASILECGHAFCTLCIEAHEYGYNKKDPFQDFIKKDDWIVLSKNDHCCPTCNQPYTRHIPCPTLDVSIYNYVKDQTSIDQYQSRMQLWTQELQKRQSQLEQNRIQEVIRLQEQELLSYKKKKHLWKDLLAPALTTFTMILITSMIGSSRKKQ